MKLTACLLLSVAFAAQSRGGPITLMGSADQKPQAKCVCECACNQDKKNQKTEAEKADDKQPLRKPVVVEERQEHEDQHQKPFRAVLEEPPLPGPLLTGYGTFGYPPLNTRGNDYDLHSGPGYNLGNWGYNPGYGFNPLFGNWGYNPGYGFNPTSRSAVVTRVCDPRNPDDICYDPTLALAEVVAQETSQEGRVAGISDSFTALSFAGSRAVALRGESDSDFVPTGPQLTFQAVNQSQVEVVPTPEPATLVTFALMGVAGAGYRRWRR